MAKMNYEHVYAAAGFSGEKFDVAAGYNQTFTSAATATDFIAINSRITLSSGTFPAWFVVGKRFVTDSATNPGPFIVKQVVSATEIRVHEAVLNEAAVTAAFNGSADPNIIATLLSVGSGALTDDAPHALVSTGALFAGGVDLTLSATEVEAVAKGGQALNGRFFYLSVQNSNISAANYLKLVPSTSINGAADFTIINKGDYLLHHISDGVWRLNVLPQPAEALATISRVSFSAADWDAGATKNTIKVLQTGAPAAGEVGPHGLTSSGSYVVQVINTDATPDELVDVETQFAANGDVTLKKSGLGNDFAGIVVILGSLD